MRRRLIFVWGLTALLLFAVLLYGFTPHPGVKERSQLIIEEKIRRGDTLSQSFVRNKISLRWIDLIVSRLSPFVDFKRMKEVTYRFIANERGDLTKFIYEVSPTEVYEIEKGVGGRYVARRKEMPLKTYLVKITGVINSSLAGAVRASGERRSLAAAIAEILAWDIDFANDARQGDHYGVIVEKIFHEDEFVKYGSIQAVEYQNGNKIIRGFLFNDKYYSEKGYTMTKAFLKSPLRYKHISSGFNRKRRHPIMGGIHPHTGIDYAAPIGTPVWAVADGFVDSCGWMGGFGKHVSIRHPNGYKSYYSHLSRYGAEIKAGMPVKQKQVIGYVGSTGFSTGPHLDYRLSKDGRFINSLKEGLPTGMTIKEKDADAFRNRKREMIALLQSATGTIYPGGYIKQRKGE